MSLIDLNQLLAPCRDDAPCGIDLSGSADYIELLRKAAGTPDVQYGDMHQEAMPPEWPAIIDETLSLLAQSHDLRLALLLTRAMLAHHGFEGLEQGLAFTSKLLQQDWEALFPHLDPEDDHDPTERNNILAELCNIEATGILGLLRSQTLIDAPGSAISLYVLQCASDPVQAAKSDGPTLDQIVSACKTCDGAALLQTAAWLGQCLAHVQNIEQWMHTQVGLEQAVNLDPFCQLLSLSQRFIEQHLPQHPQSQADHNALKVVDNDNPHSQQEAHADFSAPNAAHGEIRHRNDVVHLLQQLCQYYVEYEPSSPVPILLTRAQKLVTMNFMELMQDLAPSGLSEIQYLSGIHYSSGIGQNTSASTEAPEPSVAVDSTQQDDHLSSDADAYAW